MKSYVRDGDPPSPDFFQARSTKATCANAIGFHLGAFSTLQPHARLFTIVAESRMATSRSMHHSLNSGLSHRFNTPPLTCDIHRADQHGRQNGLAWHRGVSRRANSASAVRKGAQSGPPEMGWKADVRPVQTVEVAMRFRRRTNVDFSTIYPNLFERLSPCK